MKRQLSEAGLRTIFGVSTITLAIFISEFFKPAVVDSVVFGMGFGLLIEGMSRLTYFKQPFFVKGDA